MVEDERTFLNNPDINVVKADVEKALIEDVGTGDITGLLIHSETLSHAQIMTREAMILSGIPWANQTFYLIDPTLEIQWHYQEGELLKPNTILCHIEGRARSILTAERTVLNFIQTLSATATQTQRYVKKLAGLSTKLLDTRKTIPGLRYAQKYAVRCGGGINHRHGLYDAFLIKENHILACGSITEAIQQARKLFPEKKLEIEVETLNEFQEALMAFPDVIMLDNFDLRKILLAIELRLTIDRQKKIALEVSGNITLDNLREIAETGIDYISTGAITKHIQAIDLTLLLSE
jgi:nicotinate-nucleotide pyrophosphorylase (carboxylating)